jgi:hypothetical protein
LGEIVDPFHQLSCDIAKNRDEAVELEEALVCLAYSLDQDPIVCPSVHDGLVDLVEIGTKGADVIAASEFGVLSSLPFDLGFERCDLGFEQHDRGINGVNHRVVVRSLAVGDEPGNASDQLLGKP